MPISSTFYSIELLKGGSYAKTFTFYTDSEQTTLKDFTGNTAQMDVRDNDGDLIASWSTATGEIVLGGTAGTLTLTLSPNETKALDEGLYIYNVLIIESASSNSEFITKSYIQVLNSPTILL